MNSITSENALSERLVTNSRRVTMEQSEIVESASPSDNSGADDEDASLDSEQRQELSQAAAIDWEEVSRSLPEEDGTRRTEFTEFPDPEFDRVGLAALDELERVASASSVRAESVSPESKRRKVHQVTLTQYEESWKCSAAMASMSTNEEAKPRCCDVAKKDTKESTEKGTMVSNGRRHLDEMQFFVPKTEKSPTQKESESDERMYYPSTGVKKRLYLKGDTWSCRAKPEYFFTLSKLELNPGKGKEAVCVGGVTISLEKTFLEEDQARRVITAWKAQGRPNADKAVVANTLRILRKGKVPLKTLTHLIHRKEEWPGKPMIWYERGVNEKESSVGYTCAYRYEELVAPRQQPPQRKLQVLDVFAGCGAMSLAFDQEGFNSCYKVEIDPNAIASLRINFKSKVFPESVECFIRNCPTGGVYPRPGTIDRLHASPPWLFPCQHRQWLQ